MTSNSVTITGQAAYVWFEIPVNVLLTARSGEEIRKRAFPSQFIWANQWMETAALHHMGATVERPEIYIMEYAPVKDGAD